MTCRRCGVVEPLVSLGDILGDWWSTHELAIRWVMGASIQHVRQTQVSMCGMRPGLRSQRRGGRWGTERGRSSVRAVLRLDA
jgi:hypothetical protein